MTLQDSQNYKNPGYSLINFSEENTEEEFTPIVTGLGRSGTTMLVKILEAAGVFMGVAADAQNNDMREDIALSRAIETKDKPEIQRIVDIRNQRFDVWGFKRPLIFSFDKDIQNVFRNPRYLLIFRDPLAVALRNQISLDLSLNQTLAIFQSQLDTKLKFIRECKSPTLLISYEKMIVEPEPILEEVMRFCGVKCYSNHELQKLIITSDPAYVSNSGPK